MKYAIAVMYIPGFMKIGSDIQKLIRGYTDRMEIALAYSFFSK
jgi:hypothetical protein